MPTYVQPHVSQFDHSTYAPSNCTPASLANGIAAVSGGLTLPTAGDVRKLVARREETNPGTPGWSLEDARLAASRMSIGLSVLSGEGWPRLRRERQQKGYVLLQGDSDQFGNGTCSGAFDGDHCIGIHPQTIGSRWWIDDPICAKGRWEEESVLLRYARKLEPTIRFAVLQASVPELSHFRLEIEAHATVRAYTLSVNPSGAKPGVIRDWSDYPWGAKASSAPCSGPKRLRYKTSYVTAVLVTQGIFAGKWVRVGDPYGTTVHEV